MLNEGLLVAEALEARDAKGFNSEFKLVTTTARKRISFSGVFPRPYIPGVTAQKMTHLCFKKIRGDTLGTEGRDCQEVLMSTHGGPAAQT